MSESVLNIQSGSSAAVPLWYAAYTSPRHEKKVSAHLDVRGVEHFLPLYSSSRRWKDGSRVTVREPLFPNYVFVRISMSQRVRVLGVPGVLWMVGARSPEPLPETDIQLLRDALPGRKCEPHPFLAVGNEVRVCRGPLRGVAGVVVRVKSELRLVITIELLMRSVAVEVDAGDLEAGVMAGATRRKGPATAQTALSRDSTASAWVEAG